MRNQDEDSMLSYSLKGGREAEPGGLREHPGGEDGPGHRDRRLQGAHRGRGEEAREVGDSNFIRLNDFKG